MNQPPADRKVYIIEIKYAADTNTANQEQRAEEQHGHLHQLLLEAGYSGAHILQTNIILGAGGTIFKDNLTAMTELGVSTPDAEKALTKVHRSTVKWLHKTYTFKSMLSNQTMPRQGVG